jgi:transposase InsO family protein
MGDAEDLDLLIAAFRYRVIAEAAECSGEGTRRAILDAASKTYVDPDGKENGFTIRTLFRWLAAYRERGLSGLKPKLRKDKGSIRALSSKVLKMAADLRREDESRATKTLIDILVRKKIIAKNELKRSTLDRHLDKMGLSRRRLHTLGKTLYRKILTEQPFELVVADFHHGPYVRVGDDDKAKKALLLAFVDHFSRYVPEARYYLHEDFAALRFGFRRVLIAFGLFAKLYIDNGPSFQSIRFHAACKNEAINIDVVHSKAYVSEGRGVGERFNRTLKEQFENEVRHRDELLTLDELNAYFEAWRHERYHLDENSETGEPPIVRFNGTEHKLRPPPDLTVIDELLRLRKRATVHKKWSTIDVVGTRYVVDSGLRGRKVHALYDPFDQSHVLVEFDGKIIERAYPQKPGQIPPELSESPPPIGPKTDYLKLLRRDFEARTKSELAALRRPPPTKPQLDLAGLVDLLQAMRGTAISDPEQSDIVALFQKLRPIDPDDARAIADRIKRQLGTALHVGVYLDAFKSALVIKRTQGEKRT